MGGHVGAERMLKTIKRIYNWPTMAKDVREHESKCLICEKTKTVKTNKTPIQITSVGNHPSDHTYIDFVGPISPPSEDGHRYIFTATCDLTKYVCFKPTMDCTATTAAAALFDTIMMNRFSINSKQ